MRAFLHILTNLKTAEVKTLTASPADWQDLSIRTFRSVRYNGVFSSDGISQRFPKVGGRHEDQCGYYFISDAYETDGTDAEIKYERKILNPFTHAYVSDFVGMLDFNADAGWNYTDQWWEIKSKDSSKSSKFITRDEIDYDIFSLVSTDDVTVPDFDNPYRNALYKKVDFYLQALSSGIFPQYKSVGDSDPGWIVYFSPITPSVGSPATARWTLNGINERNELGDRNKISEEWEHPEMYENSTNQETSIVDVLASVDVRIDVIITNYSIIVSGGANLYLDFNVYDKDGASVSLNTMFLHYVFYNSDSFSIGEPIEGVTVPDFTVPAGGRVDLYLRLTIASAISGGYDATAFILEDNFLNELQFKEKTLGWSDNTIKGMMVHEAATRLFQLQTSETDISKLIYAPVLGKQDSEFKINPFADTYPTAGYLSYEHLTNGFQLRQITGRAINVSFWKLFKSLSAITPLGCVYEEDNDRLYIDTIDKFYENEVMPIHLGNVTELKTYAYKDAYYNKIFSGYKSTDYEAFNGANEVNAKTEHQTAVNTKSNKTAASEIYADTLNIEIARRANYSIEVSKDTKQDKLNFLTTLNSIYETVQGGITIIDAWRGIDQYYNLTKTPRQNLQRQLITEAAQFFKKVDGKIKFTSSSKDNNIRYVDPETGNTVNEFDDINVGNTDNSRLFNAEIDEFEGLYTYEIRQAIKNNKHKMIPYYDSDGNERFGYILEIDGLIVQQKANYKLIRANTNR